MSEQPEIHTTLEDFQGVSQKLRLTCRKCGDRADYDVGAICCDPGKEGESAGINYTFSNNHDDAKVHAMALVGSFLDGHTTIPPNDINHYPRDYFPHFFLIEKHFLALCDASKDRTDHEMEDIYSALRRRPDGRSLGAVHDFMWQVAALLLGSHTVSAAEYHALLGALVRSTRKWAVRPVSRNYVAYLRRTFQDPVR